MYLLFAIVHNIVIPGYKDITLPIFFLVLFGNLKCFPVYSAFRYLYGPMRFQPVKCNMMQLTNKHLNKIQASYTLEGTVLENVDNIKYLGVTITNDLKWNTHISNICTKANRTLGFLRRTLFSCPQNVKEAAYKGMVRPILEYGSSVWDPHPDKLQKELEKVQNRAARIIDSYCYTKV